MAIVQPASVTIAAAMDTAFNTAINGLQTQANALPIADLDAKAKSSLQTIDNKRLPYVLRTIEQHAVNHPKAVPGYHSLPDATANLAAHKKIKAYLMRIDKVKEQLEELAMRIEHNMYQFTRDFYDTAKRAEEAGTEPGIGTAIADLAPLFEGQGQQADDDISTLPAV